MNNFIKIKIKKFPGNDDIPLPKYMTNNSAGLDIYAAVNKNIKIFPNKRELIKTGIAISLPPGFEAQIRPRSGIALYNGITLINSPGTIDADYRGEIKLILINLGSKPFIVKRKDRIAQMVINKITKIIWRLEKSLDKTIRNYKGLGHTGKK